MKHLAKVFLAQIFSKYISNAHDINHITQDYSYTHKKYKVKEKMREKTSRELNLVKILVAIEL